MHVGKDGRVDTNQDLRRALIPEGWELVAAEVSPDGRWVVAAIEPSGPVLDDAPDLLLATREGDIVQRVERAVPAIHYSKGTDARLPAEQAGRPPPARHRPGRP